MAFEKVYVDVIVKFLKDGGMLPLEVVWVDGGRFDVDRVKYIERAPAKVGALSATRYTVIIGGAEKYLYFEEFKERWFVERKI